MQVRLVRVDGEAQSQNRRTRTRPGDYALQAGQSIQVFVDGRWRECVIVGGAHSELRVRTVGPGPEPRLLTLPDRE